MDWPQKVRSTQSVNINDDDDDNDDNTSSAHSLNRSKSAVYHHLSENVLSVPHRPFLPKMLLYAQQSLNR